MKFHSHPEDDHEEIGDSNRVPNILSEISIFDSQLH